VEVVRLATGARPQVAGKPLPPMHRETFTRTRAKHALVVGNRLDTDIEGAHASGVDSLIVLSGITSAAQLLTAGLEHRPTYLSEDLRGLLSAHPTVQLVNEDYRCGGWTAWAGAEALDVKSAGNPYDGLRALCAAAWTAADEGQPGLRAQQAMHRLAL
jgi:hypothetical protein